MGLFFIQTSFEFVNLTKLNMDNFDFQFVLSKLDIKNFPRIKCMHGLHLLAEMEEVKRYSNLIYSTNPLLKCAVAEYHTLLHLQLEELMPFTTGGTDAKVKIY